MPSVGANPTDPDALAERLPDAAECLESAGTEKVILLDSRMAPEIHSGMLFRNSSNGLRYTHYSMNSLHIKTLALVSTPKVYLMNFRESTKNVSPK